MCISSPSVSPPPPSPAVVVAQQDQSAANAAQAAASAAAAARGRGAFVNPTTGTAGVLGPSGSTPGTTKNPNSLF